MSEIRPGTVLPARRTPVSLLTSDGLRLVGELALPADSDPVATLICLHPLPTHGGMMDSHLLRKAAFRLPALARLAVLRFNTRGTTSPEGTSEGEFGGGEDERHDVAAAIAYAAEAGLPGRWLLGWSFGSELALKWGLGPGIEGAILLSPPLRRAGDADLDRWAPSGKPLTVLVPELDDHLGPDEARRRFARVPAAEVIAVDGARHLWVGESYVRIALTQIVRRVNPAALVPPTMTLPTHYHLPGGIVAGFDLTGKKAFVTGASRGIGQVIAVALAAAGADVAIAARSQEGLAETARQISELGRKAFAFPLDVTRQEDVAATVHEAIRLLGQLDIVVNNAGGMNFSVPLLDMRMSGWDKVMRLNLDATVYVCQAAGAHLHERGRGSVINVASVAGLTSTPGLMPYGAAKAGVISVTKTLAFEWAPAGIRVNALCPGWTATDLNRHLWGGPDGGRAVIAGVPMGRWAEPGEMAGPAVFLASDASSYMTGQVLVVDGGQLITA